MVHKSVPFQLPYLYNRIQIVSINILLKVTLAYLCMSIYYLLKTGKSKVHKDIVLTL